MRIANTNDDICLYRKDNGGAITKIIDGADCVLNARNNAMKLKVIRDASNQLILTTNYSANNSLGNPLTAIQDIANASLVHLTFSAPLTNALVYTLSINNVTDLAGNAISNGIANFSFYTPQHNDVVIDEIMADPTPQAGLPNSEWIELRNTSSYAINLRGWKVADATRQSGIMRDFILQPDSFVIVCTGAAVGGLAPFGTTVGVASFPSLDNDGDMISLYAPDGKTIHAFQYTSAWYQDELKKDGGWTLEMIDTKNPCSGISNWKASMNATGGTPGSKNSVDGVNNDETGPKLLRAFAVNNTTITLVYDEPLDSLKASTVANYTIDDGITAISATGIPLFFDKVSVALNVPIVPNTIYTIAAANIADCKGNVIGSKNSTRFGIAQDTDSLDIVINEILYNPKPDGVDYVELYNRSQKIIDLNHLYIANRNGSNIISSIQ